MATAQDLRYRQVMIDGVSIFYREVGPKGAATILLLHGLPSSSRMFESLYARLSDRFHLVAPDYPGFGHSDWPDPKRFAYTFDHYAQFMERFTETLGLERYTLLYAGLRRSGGISHGSGASDSDRIADRAECGGA
jgi:pimeloyl-ACP methyl ester carboxylesterase